MSDLRREDSSMPCGGFRKPFLGLCLGMQLLLDFSAEGRTDCLGIVRGKVLRCPTASPAAHRLEPAEHGPIRLFRPPLRLRPGESPRHDDDRWHGGDASPDPARELLRRPMAPGKIPPAKPADRFLPLARTYMQVIPAIDVLDGKVVDSSRATSRARPALATTRLRSQMVPPRRGNAAAPGESLGGTGRRRGRPFPGIDRSKLSRNIEVQVGGGIRDLRAAERHLDAGATPSCSARCSLTDHEAARAAVDLFGAAAVIAALDVEGDEVKIHGWQKRSGQTSPAGLRLIDEMGIRQVLMTDISRDGMAQAPTSRCTPIGDGDSRGLRITASGGVRGPRTVRELEAAGCDAAVVGRAFGGLHDLRR